MNRHLCITEKLKYGAMAAVYIHYDVTEAGDIVRKHLSVPGKYDQKEVGQLLDAIAARINAETIDETTPATDALQPSGGEGSGA
jgi:hypothetical protein